MSRSTFLTLAGKQHRLPIAVDLVLRRHPDPVDILEDGLRLGQVIAEAAREFESPVALPLMDLKLEKATLLGCFGVPAGEADAFHFDAAPALPVVQAFDASLPAAQPSARVRANLGALRYVAAQSDLIPVGMCIGPFSLATKLLADPITAVYLAGAGATAEDEPDVALVETALRLAQATVLHSVRTQVDAGARAMFIAEPAANKVFISPKQIAAGSDVFERFAIGPNQAVAALLASREVDLLFHCCGELVDEMLDAFCRLRPALLSLGSSRRLWEDARRVPKDIVLYGNLPSKLFYSDQVLPVAKLDAMAAELQQKMEQTHHPFILGTECDTLHVDGCGEIIRAKIAHLLHGPRAAA